jgi:hypothetical protein
MIKKACSLRHKSLTDIAVLSLTEFATFHREPPSYTQNFVVPILLLIQINHFARLL